MWMTSMWYVGVWRISSEAWRSLWSHMNCGMTFAMLLVSLCPFTWCNILQHVLLDVYVFCTVEFSLKGTAPEWSTTQEGTCLFPVFTTFWILWTLLERTADLMFSKEQFHSIRQISSKDNVKRILPYACEKHVICGVGSKFCLKQALIMHMSMASTAILHWN